MILSDPCGVALSLMTPSPPSSTRFIYAYSITSSVVKRFVHHHCDSQSRFILETQEKTTAAHRHSQGDKAAACGNKLRQVSTARPGPPAEDSDSIPPPISAEPEFALTAAAMDSGVPAPALSAAKDKLCRRCKASYDPSANTRLSCRFHPSFFVCRRHDDQKRCLSYPTLPYTLLI